jgi:TPR repeat protein
MRQLAAASLLLVAVAAGAQTSAADGVLDLTDLRRRSEAGDRGATRALAEAYYIGRGGVEQDFGEAARWFRRLATQGDARAQTSLGLMYARGLGFERNFGEARRWWSLAAAQNDPGAQNNLGILYLLGQGVAPDAAQAAFWFGRAAERGHIQAQVNLGELYYDGRGVTKDPVLAYQWMFVAATLGDEHAAKFARHMEREFTPEQVEQARERAKPLLQMLRR